MALLRSILTHAAAVAAVLAADPGCGASAAPQDPAPAVRDLALTESVHVGLIRWPVRVREGKAEACDGLGPAGVEVTEDGVVRPVVALDQRRLPTIHVLLVDTSGSMLPFLPRALLAAESYLEGLPDRDRRLLATFDEILTLEVPTGSGPLPVVRFRDAAHPKRYTALWDAVDGMLRFLEERPERKILLLLSDGCDSLSRPEVSADSVRMQARRLAQLTVLPTVVGKWSDCGHELQRFATGSRSPRTGLEPLARDTGGQLLELESTQHLARAFEAARRRLEQEATLLYRELDEEADPRDATPRRRRVRVRSLVPGCSVESAGGPVRHLPPAVEPAADVTFRRRGERLVAVVSDLVQERGSLYQATPPGRRAAALTVGGAALRSRREVELQVPAFAALRAGVHAPEDVLERLLDPDPPDLVHGVTFLELRPALARALAGEPGYGDWGRERLEAQRRQELQEVLQAAGETATPEALDLLMRARASAAEPDAGWLTPLLAEWLADVPARDGVAALERREAEAVLAGRQSAGPGRLEAGWERFLQWFPPPTAVRVRVPLLPAYDPQRGAVGFYRFLLPEPAAGGPPEERLPPRPLGLEVARWLRGVASEALDAAAVRVSALAYGHPDARETRHYRDWLYRRGAGWKGLRRAELWSVTLVLQPSGSPPDAASAVRLRAVLAADPRSGMCAAVEEHGAAAPAAALAAGLAARLQAGGRSCPWGSR